MIDRELKLRALLRAWTEGSSPLPVVKTYLEAGQKDEAIIFARGAVETANADDRARLMILLDELVAWPREWEAVLDEIAADPTIERWNALHRFASDSAIYDWRRLALQKLRDRGVNPIALFRFASSGGVIPDAIALVETGEIPPDVLVARANEPGAAKSIWLGLAAQASLLRGDEHGTLRYIKQSAEAADGFSIPTFSLLWLLEHAESEELRAALERIAERDGR